MLNRRTINQVSGAIVVAVAVVIGFWLWSDYNSELALRRLVLEQQGQAVLTALEGGIRSHRRVDSWARDNIEAVLDETAADPSIEGLGLFTEAGQPLAAGGAMPDQVRLGGAPQWTAQGLLVWRMTHFMPPEGLGMGGGGPMGRGPLANAAGEEMQSRRRGRPAGMTNSTPLLLDPEMEPLMRGPVWMAALMNDEGYGKAIVHLRWRFVATAAITLAALGLGLASLSLVQRHGRLRAELDLARERQQRLEEMAMLGAGLAHETKNPLSVIRGLGQSLLEEHDATARRLSVGRLIDETDRMVGRINAFLKYSRPAEPHWTTVDLGALAQETAMLFADEARAKDIALTVQAGPFAVRADAGMVRQALVNLLVNALAACAPGDAIGLALTRESGGATLSITDTGRGIAAEDLPRITRPYFSRTPGGTGLGLAITRQILDLHGWALQFESTEGQGTTVRIGPVEERHEA